MDDEVPCSAGGFGRELLYKATEPEARRQCVHELTPTAFFIGKQWAKSWIADKNPSAAFGGVFFLRKEGVKDCKDVTASKIPWRKYLCGCTKCEERMKCKKT
eukprot:scaffold59_cov133-Skeletonema_dohrnii-CCMP3373.AAC.16